MMLIGTWRVRLEDGRLALPQPFRSSAADGLTITRGFDHCLQAFPAATWQALARRVSTLPLTADAARTFRRMLFGTAVDLAPGTLEALTIPRSLLAYAEITTQAVCIGCNSYFEIWSPEALRATGEHLPASDRLASLFAGLATGFASPAL